jgi:hypothetical protein
VRRDDDYAAGLRRSDVLKVAPDSLGGNVESETGRALEIDFEQKSKHSINPSDHHDAT